MAWLLLMCLFQWAVLLLLWEMSVSPNPNSVWGLQAALAAQGHPREMLGDHRIHILHWVDRGVMQVSGKDRDIPWRRDTSLVAARLVPPQGTHLCYFNVLNLFVFSKLTCQAVASSDSTWGGGPNKPQAGAAELRDGLIPNKYSNPSSEGNGRSFRRRGKNLSCLCIETCWHGRSAEMPPVISLAPCQWLKPRAQPQGLLGNSSAAIFTLQPALLSVIFP